MIDRTQEDINQDAKISHLESEIAGLKESQADLVQRLAEAHGMAERFRQLLEPALKLQDDVKMLSSHFGARLGAIEEIVRAIEAFVAEAKHRLGLG